MISQQTQNKLLQFHIMKVSESFNNDVVDFGFCFLKWCIGTMATITLIQYISGV